MTFLGEIFTIRKGRKKVESFENTSLRYIQIDDLRNNDYLKYCVKNPKNVLCDPSDILIAWDGANAGTIGYGLKGAIGSTIAKLSTERKDVFIPYVGKFLQSKSKYLRERCTGTTIPHISRNELYKIKIPLPPLETQKKIAAILDKADELRRNDKKILEKYDQLAQSVFLEMFGPSNLDYSNRKEIKIQELASKQKGSMRTGPFGSDLLHSEFVDSGIAVLGIDNAVDNIFSWKGRRFITDEKYKKLKRYTVYPHDVLITIMGTIGRSVVIPEDIGLAINTKHLAAITVDRKICNPFFLTYSIHSDRSILQQLNLQGRGAIMTGLNLSIIKDLVIKYPPINEQNKFANILIEIESQKQLTQKSLQKSEDLFHSLLQRAFKGELV